MYLCASDAGVSLLCAVGVLPGGKKLRNCMVKRAPCSYSVLDDQECARRGPCAITPCSATPYRAAEKQKVG